ncbi:hypothetical protein DOTSEDRAFT_69357 [Dothistroma septosporum NZE10]|uniref:Uncharacterized protein n=1 Tax=Dothistroma septosporum (strain NZE10 / CBS 128990) TaxID=675120 RepID=N1PVI9_DOTSN|nr:hypothetical protein DOTSEDRAFT_69357 [Dothistroma septosporum NZE10]
MELTFVAELLQQVLDAIVCAWWKACLLLWAGHGRLHIRTCITASAIKHAAHSRWPKEFQRPPVHVAGICTSSKGRDGSKTEREYQSREAAQVLDSHESSSTESQVLEH